MCQIALTPAANPMTLAAQCGGHLEIRGVIAGGDPEEPPTAQGQRLGGGMSAHKRLDPGMVLCGQRDGTCKRHRHSPGPSKGGGRHLT
jgi:hypothetical protein